MTVTKNDPAVRAFRDTLGMFPTGVTVITARAPGGAPIGLTVSSFNSVSLTPPLVVWSLSSHLPSVPIFESAAVYAINVLAEGQQDLSQRFASRADDKFAGVAYSEGEGGVPILTGCAASFQCRQFARHPGGDHVIFIGEVVAFDRDVARRPLVFQGGAYRHLA
ncbi:flavin reductase family protein [Zoogloea sp.]|uniref:flavin reductase family protein n=1 Tax=Zoogloea sp. TaxID=49181 RepID=UPI00261DCA98|nr:flavin reductase family protein [Zoogloea sp.]MDD3352925.1 flavin reductase family protein [Zoogloea sp.]